jgi:hypothetical protein
MASSHDGSDAALTALAVRGTVHLLRNAVGDANTDGHPWQQVHAAPALGLVVCASDARGTSLRRYRGVFELPFAPSIVFACMNTPEQRYAWDPAVARIERQPLAPPPSAADVRRALCLDDGGEGSAAAAQGACTCADAGAGADAAALGAPPLSAGVWASIDLFRAVTKPVLAVSSRDFLDACTLFTAADGSILTGGTGLEADPR